MAKTTFILFLPKNKKIPANISVQINSCPISQVIHTKFLGIIIDNKLSWNQHITQLSNKIARNISVLYKLREALPHKLLLNMYYTFIYPLFTYGINLWGNTYKSNISKLIGLQKRVIRVIHNCSYLSHTNILFKQSKILKLTDITKLETLKFVIKYNLGILPSIFKNYFTFNNSNTRQAHFLSIPKYRTNYRSFSIQIQGARLYNELCANTNINFKSVKILSNYLTNYIISNY